MEALKKLNTSGWRVILSGIVSSSVLALFGWVLIETHTLGTTQVTKEELNKHQIENRQDFKDVQNLIRRQQYYVVESIDKIKDLIIELNKE